MHLNVLCCKQGDRLRRRPLERLCAFAGFCVEPVQAVITPSAIWVVSPGLGEGLAFFNAHGDIFVADLAQQAFSAQQFSGLP